MTDQPEPGSREEAAMRREMGKGPFKYRHEGDFGDIVVLDSGGHPFCWVRPRDCIGGDLSATKARAGRIAEALNVQEGHSKPIPFIDGEGNLRAPAGYGFVAKGAGVEMAPLINVTMAPAQ